MFRGKRTGAGTPIVRLLAFPWSFLRPTVRSMVLESRMNGGGRKKGEKSFHVGKTLCSKENMGFDSNGHHPHPNLPFRSSLATLVLFPLQPCALQKNKKTGLAPPNLLARLFLQSWTSQEVHAHVRPERKVDRYRSCPLYTCGRCCHCFQQVQCRSSRW